MGAVLMVGSVLTEKHITGAGGLSLRVTTHTIHTWEPHQPQMQPLI